MWKCGIHTLKWSAEKYSTSRLWIQLQSKSATLHTIRNKYILQYIQETYNKQHIQNKIINYEKIWKKKLLSVAELCVNYYVACRSHYMIIV